MEEMVAQLNSEMLKDLYSKLIELWGLGELIPYMFVCLIFEMILLEDK